MKKFLSLAAVLCLLLALAVPGFAAVPSVEYDDGTAVTAQEEPVETTEEGDTIHVEVSDITFADEEEKQEFEDAVNEKIEAELPAAVQDDITSVIAVEVDLVNQDGEVVNDDYFESADSLTVLFVIDRDAGDEVVLVLHQKDDGEIESLPFSDDGEKVSVTFSGLSPVVFVLKAAEATPDKPFTPGGEGDNNGSGGGSGANKSAAAGKSGSPQTSDGSAVSIVVGVCLIAAAAVCVTFATRRARQ